MTRRTLALLLCLACGCSRGGRLDEAPGTYVLKMRFAADTLWVAPDGSYTHAYRSEDQKAMVSRGRWRYELLNNRPHVTFHSFPVRTYFGSVPDSARTGIWTTAIERRSSGLVVLPVDEENGLNYRKVSPSLAGSAGRGR